MPAVTSRSLSPITSSEARSTIIFACIAVGGLLVIILALYLIFKVLKLSGRFRTRRSFVVVNRRGQGQSTPDRPSASGAGTIEVERDHPNEKVVFGKVDGADGFTASSLTTVEGIPEMRYNHDGYSQRTFASTRDSLEAAHRLSRKSLSTPPPPLPSVVQCHDLPCPATTPTKRRSVWKSINLLVLVGAGSPKGAKASTTPSQPPPPPSTSNSTINQKRQGGSRLRRAFSSPSLRHSWSFKRSGGTARPPTPPPPVPPIPEYINTSVTGSSYTTPTSYQASGPAGASSPTVSPGVPGAQTEATPRSPWSPSRWIQEAAIKVVGAHPSPASIEHAVSAYGYKRTNRSSVAGNGQTPMKGPTNRGLLDSPDFGGSFDLCFGDMRFDFPWVTSNVSFGLVAPGSQSLIISEHASVVLASAPGSAASCGVAMWSGESGRHRIGARHMAVQGGHGGYGVEREQGNDSYVSERSMRAIQNATSIRHTPSSSISGHSHRDVPHLHHNPPPLPTDLPFLKRNSRYPPLSSTTPVKGTRAGRGSLELRRSRRSGQGKGRRSKSDHGHTMSSGGAKENRPVDWRGPSQEPGQGIANVADDKAGVELVTKEAEKDSSTAALRPIKGRKHRTQGHQDREHGRTTGEMAGEMVSGVKSGEAILAQ
ncbi:hypothetical protein DFP72DRAFT_274157 [Ephemerocybe angulata]|uniref:Uncharacterized protein n=1 Tax=Ephemerocybe angulata TaxID=980116 RepID=A0A8H6I0K8_9AGAR|nr:hypothetical protein DFP72DRAFT_274157 [Tulosesus angulatus]